MTRERNRESQDIREGYQGNLNHHSILEEKKMTQQRAEDCLVDKELRALSLIRISNTKILMIAVKILMCLNHSNLLHQVEGTERKLLIMGQITCQSRTSHKGLTNLMMLDMVITWLEVLVLWSTRRKQKNHQGIETWINLSQPSGFSRVLCLQLIRSTYLMHINLTEKQSLMLSLTS